MAMQTSAVHGRKGQPDFSVAQKLIHDRTLMYSKAINARSWDPERAPWCFVSDANFAADLTFIDGSLDGHRVGKVETMEFWKSHCERYPEFKLEITDITTTVHETGWYADSWMNCDVLGEADGVSRKLVCRAGWQYEDAVSDWKCISTSCYIGMSPSPF